MQQKWNITSPGHGGKNMKEKPILFRTEMVKAIDAGIKTETRRVVKPQPTGERIKNNPLFQSPFKAGDYRDCPHGLNGDILWVRETFGRYQNGIIYKSENKYNDIIDNDPDNNWKPSIFMPRAAARLFLKIKNVKVERLLNISLADIRTEGCYPPTFTGWIGLWDSINAKPKPVKRDGEINHYVSYPWQDVQEVREHKEKPWHVHGNPWVWVIQFEKIKN